MVCQNCFVSAESGSLKHLTNRLITGLSSIPKSFCNLASQSSLMPSNLTDGIPHLNPNLYVKYFCVAPIIKIDATTVSVCVVVEKYGMIHSLDSGFVMFLSIKRVMDCACCSKSYMLGPDSIISSNSFEPSCLTKRWRNFSDFALM